MLRSPRCRGEPTRKLAGQLPKLGEASPFAVGRQSELLLPPQMGKGRNGNLFAVVARSGEVEACITAQLPPLKPLSARRSLLSPHGVPLSDTGITSTGTAWTSPTTVPICAWSGRSVGAIAVCTSTAWCVPADPTGASAEPPSSVAVTAADGEGGRRVVELLLVCVATAAVDGEGGRRVVEPMLVSVATPTANGEGGRRAAEPLFAQETGGSMSCCCCCCCCQDCSCHCNGTRACGWVCPLCTCLNRTKLGCEACPTCGKACRNGAWMAAPTACAMAADAALLAS
mmetsp:Transcript_144173/g.359450  ORF Transcript_144173/g.359450 Transcript_144173/m.359450 type:complete len:285 (+) Transcript_144173:1979-2833(+)